jgi:TatD DNase family protein
LIDIGANLANRAFDADRAEVVERANAAGLTHIVITATSIAETHAALDLCERWPDLLTCTAGIHPHDAARAPAGWQRDLADIAQRPHVRAIGETGLDFNRNYSPRGDQLAVFRAQIELALELGKPLFVHDRDTAGATAALLEEYRPALSAAGLGVVVHCFTGSAQDLACYLEAGYYIGITGWVCDERRGQTLQQLVPQIPDDRLMIETDAPYLTPRTLPGRQRQRRNEPANLVWVARTLADLRNQPVADIAQVTAANAARFFALDR